MKIITYQTEAGSISPDWNFSLNEILASAGIKSVQIEPASNGLREALDHWNGLEDLLHILNDHEPDTTNIRLFISASNDSKYREYCLRQLGHAAWGCCLSETIAIEYAPANARLTTQLHETLHLFGVGECYDERTQTPLASCQHQNCIMRYGVVSTQVCSNVIAQLKS